MLANDELFPLVPFVKQYKTVRAVYYAHSKVKKEVWELPET